MKLQKMIASLFVCVLLLIPAAVTSAGPPPQGDDPSPENSGFDPVPIQPGILVVDRATGGVIRAELSNTAQAQQTAPVDKLDDPASTTFRSERFEGNTHAVHPGETIRAQDMIIGDSTPSGRSDEEISTAASTIITVESFEGTFPTGSWDLFGTHDWGKANCLAVHGNWSVWPAVDVADPCGGATYPDNVEAWLDFGPFSLADAETASLDFFFRLDSQSCDPLTDCDYLFWGASTDRVNFAGDFVAGTHVGGPFNNGYNFASLDLSFVAGQPEVWISFAFVSNGDGITGQGPFVDLVSLRKNSDSRVVLTDETFDIDLFPNSSWINFDYDGSVNGEYLWDDLFCYSKSGFWAMWPAYGGANALDPCFAGDPYANNMDSWLVHGPLDLTGASEAWVDFYFRNESEPDFDWFSWMASRNGNDFSGFGVSGYYIEGPHHNGYNLLRFDLSNVPTLGDLRGEPEVWLAFIFESDEIITDRGPFIDDVSVVIERAAQDVNKVFLPIVFNNPTPVTKLFITNHTGGSLTYKVKNTPEGTKSCSVANNQQKLCATFTSGTYDWVANAHCGDAFGTREFQPGDDYPKPFECQ